MAAIRGSDLHLYHGMMPNTRVGMTFGHEFIGVVDEVGPDVRDLRPGDRVMVPFNVFCGTCWFCARGRYSNCHNVNPNATAVGGIYGYSHTCGGYDGGQSEYVLNESHSKNTVAGCETVGRDATVRSAVTALVRPHWRRRGRSPVGGHPLRRRLTLRSARFGYPGNRNGGEIPWTCEGTTNYGFPDYRPTLYCAWTGGFSGGPWFREYSNDTLLGYVNGVGSTWPGPDDGPEWIDSPYFDGKVQSIYDDAAGD